MKQQHIDDPTMSMRPQAIPATTTSGVLDAMACQMALILAVMSPLIPLFGVATYTSDNLLAPTMHLLLVSASLALGIFRQRLSAQQITAVYCVILLVLAFMSVAHWGARSPVIMLLVVSLFAMAIFLGPRVTAVWGTLALLVFAGLNFHVPFSESSEVAFDFSRERWVAVIAFLSVGMFCMLLSVRVAAPLVGVLEDAHVTQQKAQHHRWLAERGAIDSTNHLNNILDNAPVGITLFDEKGEVTGWNTINERFLGVTSEQMLGQSLQDFLSGIDDKHPLIGKLDELFHGRSFYNLLLEVPTEAGFGTLVLSANPVFDKMGRVSGGVMIGSEISSLLKQVSDLGFKSVAEEPASIAQDIRSPLMSLGLSVETLSVMLENENPDLDRIRNKIPLILQQQAEAAEIVEAHTDQVLTQAVSKRPNSVMNLTRASVAVIEAGCVSREISVSVDDSLAEEGQVAAHSVLVRQVLINLLINAREAIESHRENHYKTPYEGRISVAVETGPKEITWIVSDNGGGKLPEDPEQLFKQGYTTKPFGEGDGMGLFIGRATAEHLGGSLTASRGVEGLCLQLTLPRYRG